MPKEDSERPQPLLKSLALTLLLDDNDRIIYYHGDFDEAIKTNKIFETNYSTYSGIGKIIRQKQKDIDARGKFTDGRRGLMLLIKPTAKADYKNVVDALDEAAINDVKKYAIIEPNTFEINFLKIRSGH